MPDLFIEIREIKVNVQKEIQDAENLVNQTSEKLRKKEIELKEARRKSDFVFGEVEETKEKLQRAKARLELMTMIRTELYAWRVIV